MKPARAAVGLLWLAVLAGLLQTLWPFQLLIHFRVQYLVIALLFLLVKDRPTRTASALLALGLALALSGAYLSPERPTVQGTRIFISNVHADNRDHVRLLNTVRQSGAEVVALIEVSHELAPLLEQLAEYPGRAILPRDDYFGLALLSRRPLAESRVEALPLPTLFATTEDGLKVIVTHPPPPISADYARLRDEQLQELADRLSGRQQTVLVGDLNTTSWARGAKILEGAGLRNARNGFGVLPTWPTHNKLLMIPIDHCFLTPDLTPLGCRLGDEVGSDHLPLIVEFAR